jgi:hypothetical protein
MKLIESKTLATAASSIDFTSIPQDGTDLVVLISARTNASGFRSGQISFNSSTSDFSNRSLDGTGSVATSFSEARYVGTLPGTTATADTFGNTLVYIPNYSGATNKSFNTNHVVENNATIGYPGISAGLWSNTAAITSLSFSPSTDSLIAGSTISLYKITKGSDGIVTTS